MSEIKGLVKCALGFILTLAVVFGSIYGLNAEADVTDTDNPISEEEAVPTEEETATATDEVVESPADSTPTEEETPCVDESVEAEVTEPTDEPETTVTEGEI